MIHQTPVLVWEVTVTSAAAMDRELDAAVLIARERSPKDFRGGILVTRKGPTSFLVAVSPDVPYGTTEEKLIW